METDSALIFQLLTKEIRNDALLDVLLIECHALLRLDWSVEVKRVFREANFVADGLANWVLDKPISYYPLPNPLLRFVTYY